MIPQANLGLHKPDSIKLLIVIYLILSSCLLMCMNAINQIRFFLTSVETNIDVANGSIYVWWGNNIHTGAKSTKNYFRNSSILNSLLLYIGISLILILYLQ